MVASCNENMLCLAQWGFKVYSAREILLQFCPRPLHAN